MRQSCWSFHFIWATKCNLILPPRYKNTGLQEQHLQSSIIVCCCMTLLRYAQLDITYVNAVESAVKLSSFKSYLWRYWFRLIKKKKQQIRLYGLRICCVSNRYTFEGHFSLSCTKHRMLFATNDWVICKQVSFNIYMTCQNIKFRRVSRETVRLVDNEHCNGLYHKVVIYVTTDSS